jgi:hypothetical protein
MSQTWRSWSPGEGWWVVDESHPDGAIVNTPEDQARADAEVAARTSAATVLENARAALTQLRQARTVLAGTPTNAQILQAVRLHNDVLIALVKLEVRDFATDD